LFYKSCLGKAMAAVMAFAKKFKANLQEVGK